MSSVLCLVFCACALGVVMAFEPFWHEQAKLHFERFIVDHGKEYAHEHEKQHRFTIFKANLEKAHHMNKKSKSVVYGITKFMDLTPEEFEQRHTGFRKFGNALNSTGSCTAFTDDDITGSDAPESFDWREQNVVTPVKSQETCGGCYAFAVVGNVESQVAIKKQQAVSLSEQQIIDCDATAHGCNGGIMSQAIESLIKEGGSEGEQDYPFENQQGSCRFDANKVKVQVTECHTYDLTSQEKLKQLLYQNGPLVVGVRGSPLQTYHGGILPDGDCSYGSLNHAVLLVGYGVENNNPFWVVKNSWGTGWGEQGFYRVQRGEGFDSCGMVNDAMCSAVIA